MMNMKSVEDKKALLNNDHVIQQSFGGPYPEGWITQLRESKESLFTNEFLPNPPPFFFKERLSKFDWKEISKVDPNKIKANVDLPKMSSILNNLVFGYVDSEDLEKYGERISAKTIHLLQYSVEYLLYVQDYVTKSCELLDSKYKELDEDYRIVYEIAKKRKKQIEQLKDDLKNKRKVIDMYELMIEKSNNDDALAYSCIYCPEKFLSLHLLKQHHNQFHKSKPFDEDLYSKNIVHKNSKERKEIEQRIFEEQQKRDQAREKELKILKDDLDSLKVDVSKALKVEITGVVKENDENLKMMDKKIEEMKKILSSSLSHKDDHRKWVEDHEKTQESQFITLQAHIDKLLVKYKEDLDNKLKYVNVSKDNVAQDLQAEIASRDNELLKYKKTIDQLKLDLSKAQDKLMKYEKEYKSLESTTKQLEDENAKTAASIQLDKDQLVVLQKHNDSLSKLNDELRDKTKKLEKENLTLKSQMEGKEGESVALVELLKIESAEKDIEITQLKKEMEKVKLEKSKSENEVRALNNKILELTDELIAKENTITQELQKKLTEQQKEEQRKKKEEDDKKKKDEEDKKKKDDEDKKKKDEEKKKQDEEKKRKAKENEEKMKKDAEEKRKKVLEEKKKREEELKKKQEEEIKNNNAQIIQISEEIYDGPSHHDDINIIQVKERDDKIEGSKHKSRKGSGDESPRFVSKKEVIEYIKNNEEGYSMLEHKYKEPIQTVFRHRLTEFDEIDKKVYAQSEIFEEKKIKSILNTDGKIDTLSKEQIDRAQADLRRGISNERQKEISEYISTKLDNIESDKKADKHKAKAMKHEEKNHQKWIKFKENYSKDKEGKNKIEIKEEVHEEKKSSKNTDKVKKDVVAA